jgi:hypothetical protein
MAKWTIATAVALLATITSTQVVAQGFSDPDAFQAQHPDRDVLNGGALTPAAKAAAGLDNPTGVYGVGGNTNSVSARGHHQRFRRHR